MNMIAKKPFCLQRYDGMFVSEYAQGKLSYTFDLMKAKRFSKDEALFVIHNYIPKHEWTAWNVLTLVGFY